MNLSSFAWRLIIAGIILFLIGTILNAGPPVRFDPPAVREVQPAAPAWSVRRAGDHSHLCPRCRAEWWHGSGSFGRAGDHHCPACGYGPVWSVYRR